MKTKKIKCFLKFLEKAKLLPIVLTIKKRAPAKISPGHANEFIFGEF